MMPDFGDLVDMPAFSQILEMDDSETERDFSKTLVMDFFQQAQVTFVDMENALAKQKLDDLGKLGHFLKGSSATLGFVKIRDSCETLQRYGKSPEKREPGEPEIADDKRLEMLEKALSSARIDAEELEKKMNVFFDYNPDEE